MLQERSSVATNRSIDSVIAPGLPENHYRRAAELADQAVEALIAEASLTPKPALVDGRGSGAHQDLNLHKLLRSARSLRPGFLAMGRISSGREAGVELREQLARIGRAAEARMLLVTEGANAHRGAIWVLGLLVAAKAMNTMDAEAEEIVALAGRIAMLPDRYAPANSDSHGARACLQHGVRGARGEAAAGFPHVIRVGLPMLRASRLRGSDETNAQLDALMAIMSSLDDTCLLHRGGRAALVAAQRGASEVLEAGGASCPVGRQKLFDLDAQLMAMNASPGGCADLLAACIFLDG
jgi:triphosphoribosyl-dephospho-CoA synthase